METALQVAVGVFVGMLAFIYRRHLGKFVLGVVVIAVYSGIAYGLGYLVFRYLFQRPDTHPLWVILVGAVLVIGAYVGAVDIFEWFRFRRWRQDRNWRIARVALRRARRVAAQTFRV